MNETLQEIFKLFSHHIFQHNGIDNIQKLILIDHPDLEIEQNELELLVKRIIELTIYMEFAEPKININI